VPLRAHDVPSDRGNTEAALVGPGWTLNPARHRAAHLAAGRLVGHVSGLVLEPPLVWQTPAATPARSRP
jgi:LysR family transcriptional regulator, chromosome initiation inhibitor